MRRAAFILGLVVGSFVAWNVRPAYDSAQTAIHRYQQVITLGGLLK